MKIHFNLFLNFILKIYQTKPDIISAPIIEVIPIQEADRANVQSTSELYCNKAYVDFPRLL
jgi:hypothetical protein